MSRRARHASAPKRPSPKSSVAEGRVEPLEEDGPRRRRVVAPVPGAQEADGREVGQVGVERGEEAPGLAGDEVGLHRRRGRRRRGRGRRRQLRGEELAEAVGPVAPHRERDADGLPRAVPAVVRGDEDAPRAGRGRGRARTAGGCRPRGRPAPSPAAAGVPSRGGGAGGGPTAARAIRPSLPEKSQFAGMARREAASAARSTSGRAPEVEDRLERRGAAVAAAGPGAGEPEAVFDARRAVGRLEDSRVGLEDRRRSTGAPFFRRTVSRRSRRGRHSSPRRYRPPCTSSITKSIVSANP